MKNTVRALALILVAFLLIPCLSGCGGKDGNREETTGNPDNEALETDLDAVSLRTAPLPVIPIYSGKDTLVVGYDKFSEKFSPFFSKTIYDYDVAGITQVKLLASDRHGNIILNGIEGETISYNGINYIYNGIADCNVVRKDDGSVTYEIKLRKDVFFSDGVNLTADDVIFSMYVLSDPTYDGKSPFSTLPVAGMDDYRKGMSSLSSLILAAGPDGTSQLFTSEQASDYWNAFNEAGAAFAQEIVSYCLERYTSYAGQGYGGKYTSEEIASNEGLGVAYGMRMWAYGSWVKDADGNYTGEFSDAQGTLYDCETTFPTIDIFWNNIVAAYGYDISDEGINKEHTPIGSGIGELISAKLGDKAGIYAVAVKTGDSADKISGIEKTGMYSLKITMTEFDVTSIYKLSIPVAPLHYYASRSAYKYSENKFGFTKGDLTGVKAKTASPMGAGPYKFISYMDGEVSFVRNEYYYRGCPKIANLKFRETISADKVTGLISGLYDIADPSSDNVALSAIKAANSNGELTGSLITYSPLNNQGYGYIGINANNVKVGGDPASSASKNLRKAFATVFAVYRDAVIKNYYGERAVVIQYPISATSWAAPQVIDEGYRVCYSADVDGKAIFTANITQDEKENAALNAAIEYFKAAGYTWDENNRVFTSAPAGASLSYEFIVPAGGKPDHPVLGIVASAKDALAKVGITITVNNPNDPNVLWASLKAGSCAMWTAPWVSEVDPDMYNIYHSSNTAGLGGTDLNYFAIADPTLDSLITEARNSEDFAERKAIYRKCLDIILDWAVEVPAYQKQNMVIYSSERVKIATITPNLTPFWSWSSEIEKLEMN